MAKAFAWLMESKMPDPRAVVVETSVGKLVFQPETLEILEAGWPKWKMTESKIPPPSSFWWSSLDCHLEWSHRESEKRHRALGSLDVEPIGAFWTRTMAYISIPHELFRVKNSNLNATKPMDPILTSPKLLSRFTLFKRSQLPTHLPAVPPATFTQTPTPPPPPGRSKRPPGSIQNEARGQDQKKTTNFEAPIIVHW